MYKIYNNCGMDGIKILWYNNKWGEKVEGFYFHNNWKVQVDYGMNMTEIPFSDYNEIDESSLPSKDVLYCRGGRSSDYFRILKLFKDGKLISEVRF